VVEQRLFRRLTEDVPWDAFEIALNKAIPIYRPMPLFDDIEKFKNDTAKLLH
jgi:hypothetical protein